MLLAKAESPSACPSFVNCACHMDSCPASLVPEGSQFAYLAAGSSQCVCRAFRRYVGRKEYSPAFCQLPQGSPGHICTGVEPHKAASLCPPEEPQTSWLWTDKEAIHWAPQLLDCLLGVLLQLQLQKEQTWALGHPE